MSNLVGDSSAGKTMLALTALAEAANDPRFKEHELIYDDVEAANLFDIRKLFGSKLARRIRGVQPDPDDPARQSCDTIEEFRDQLRDLQDSGKKYVYVLDSFDSLSSNAERDREKVAKKKGEDESGSYKTEKPKMLSEILRKRVRYIESSGSYLIIISQTRDNINAMSMEKKIRSGGRALKFYALLEIWLAHFKAQKKQVTGVKMQIGNRVRADVKKNKVTGKRRRELDFDIFYDYGVDSVGAAVDWLVATKHWPKSGSTISHTLEADGLPEKAQRTKLVSVIEENGLQKELFETVQEKWDLLEEGARLNRPSKYE